MSTIFSYEVRLIACQNCGGPLEGMPQGGSFQCTFCQAVNQVTVRSEDPILAHQPTPVNEHERIIRLRQQDGRPLVPPASLQALMPGGQIPVWKIQEAVQVWNGTRQELATTANFEAAERLVFLTMALANHFFDAKDFRRQRSMFESALDAVTLPRHRQVMRGYLCRSAVRENDLAAAERWLAPCDKQSDDLETDSAFRFSRAYIDTARGDFNAVLHWLGRDLQEVPLMDSVDAAAAVLRANAWERLGQVQVATKMLAEYMRAGGAAGRQVVLKIIQSMPAWRLCAQSFRAASSEHSARAGRIAAQRAGGGIHKVFVPLGALFLVVGIGSAVVAVGGVVAPLLGYEMEMAAGIGITAFTLAATFLLMGVIFFGIGMVMRKAAARAERLRVHGLHATGTIMDVSPTGLAINNVPQFRITLTVQLPHQAPYQASTKMLLSNPGGLAAGSTVALRVDPQKLTDVLIETD